MRNSGCKQARDPQASWFARHGLGRPRRGLMLALCASLALGGCASNGRYSWWGTPSRGFDPSLGVSASPRVAWGAGPLPKGGGTYKIGGPYQVAGRWHVPAADPHYDATGLASWYGDDFHGRRTSNGEIYDMRALTAAHPTLPMPCYAYVTNLRNNRTVLLRINDRGPYVEDRLIDLSQAAAQALAMERQGLAYVRVRYAGPAPLNGNDAREHRFLASQPWAHDPLRYAGTRPNRGQEPLRAYAWWSAPLYRAGLARR